MTQSLTEIKDNILRSFVLGDIADPFKTKRERVDFYEKWCLELEKGSVKLLDFYSEMISYKSSVCSIPGALHVTKSLDSYREDLGLKSNDSYYGAYEIKGDHIDNMEIIKKVG